MLKLMNRIDAYRVTADMCCFGMESYDNEGAGKAKKPTDFITNCPCIASALERRCNGEHRHVRLLHGRAAKAQVYPRDLCIAICQSLKEQLKIDRAGLFQIGSVTLKGTKNECDAMKMEAEKSAQDCHLDVSELPK